MKHLLILFLIASLIMFSCKKDEPKADENQVLQERFQGKYKILSATSEQSVDINMDGVASQNLLNEIPNLHNSFLELRFITNSNPQSSIPSDNLFVLFWQEQDLNYESDKTKPAIMYLNQSYPFAFSFNSDHTEILTRAFPGMSTADAERYVVPKAVQILDNNRLRASFTKKVYTSTGFRQVTVQLLYERWTSAT